MLAINTCPALNREILIKSVYISTHAGECERCVRTESAFVDRLVLNGLLSHDVLLWVAHRVIALEIGKDMSGNCSSLTKTYCSPTVAALTHQERGAGRAVNVDSYWC
jgi:hypothetical protein